MSSHWSNIQKVHQRNNNNQELQCLIKCLPFSIIWFCRGKMNSWYCKEMKDIGHFLWKASWSVPLSPACLPIRHVSKKQKLFSEFYKEFLALFPHRFWFFTTHFEPMVSLWAAITLKRSLRNPNQILFLNSQCVRVPWVLAPKKFPAGKFRLRKVSPKISLFRQFPCRDGWSIEAVCAQFWCHQPST